MSTWSIATPPDDDSADYPRPSVAVDTAVLTVLDDQLQVLLVPGDGRLGLPGTFVHEGEVLADAVRRSLREKAGVVGIEPFQLQVFDALDRDDRGWVLSVAHWAAVTASRLTGVGASVELVAVERRERSALRPRRDRPAGRR